MKEVHARRFNTVSQKMAHNSTGFVTSFNSARAKRRGEKGGAGGAEITLSARHQLQWAGRAQTRFCGALTDRNEGRARRAAREKRGRVTRRDELVPDNDHQQHD